jgi:4-hydroxy-3-methylbut-2-en-1-yl diphosphate reductase
MRVLRSRHLGMCFGVRDAIALAVEASASQPLTILGDLVHNEAVLQDLRSRGIRVQSDIGAVETALVMVTAHGASDRRLAEARERGLSVLDATCPLVRAAHRVIAELAGAGYHPVIVGQRDHVEVRGLTEDLAAFDVVLDEADVERLAPRPRFAVASQTTQPTARVEHLASLVRRRFPASEVRVADTVCTPTKRHQQAAIDLARLSDVVVVVGGKSSNNTRELADTCRRYCAQVHHVQGPDDLDPGWFFGAGIAGVTAGTSTPDEVVDAVEARMRECAERRATAWRRSA